MALLRQCLKLQRERSGVPAQEIDFPPVDAETLSAISPTGLVIGCAPEPVRDAVRRPPRVRAVEPVPD
jgi:hypothetical protein